MWQIERQVRGQRWLEDQVLEMASCHAFDVHRLFDLGQRGAVASIPGEVGDLARDLRPERTIHRKRGWQGLDRNGEGGVDSAPHVESQALDTAQVGDWRGKVGDPDRRQVWR